MSASAVVEVTHDHGHFITTSDLIELLGSSTEYAFIDVREAVSVQHPGTPLVAVHIPASRIEVDIGRLVPRRSTPIVLIDGGGEEQTARRAAAVPRGGGSHEARGFEGSVANKPANVPVGAA